jgi:hypothetical protein
LRYATTEVTVRRYGRSTPGADLIERLHPQVQSVATLQLGVADARSAKPAGPATFERFESFDKRDEHIRLLCLYKQVRPDRTNHVERVRASKRP